MAAKAGLAAGVDLGACLGFEGPGARPESGEPGVAVSGTLAGPFPFAVAPLGVESSSGLLRTAESLWGSSDE